MLSNREIKWIQSLKNKKYRLKHRAYLAEGPRLVNDLIINGERAVKIIRTADVDVPGEHADGVVAVVDDALLKKLSAQVSPAGVIAVFDMPEPAAVNGLLHPAGEWGVALDFIQDPGNLGTILRTLDWLDIRHLYCSSDSVEAFNPKVVQASMGAVARVPVRYVDLAGFLAGQEVPVYAAETGGTAINSGSLEPGIIVFGNEGSGISPAVRSACSAGISIPRLGKGESLNIAVTVAIMSAWFRMQ